MNKKTVTTPRKRALIIDFLLNREGMSESNTYMVFDDPRAVQDLCIT
jgi:hypothetical protein